MGQVKLSELESNKLDVGLRTNGVDFRPWGAFNFLFLPKKVMADREPEATL